MPFANQCVSSKEDITLNIFSQNTWGVPVISSKRKKRYQNLSYATQKIDADLFLLQETFSKEFTEKYFINPWQRRYQYFSRGNEKNLATLDFTSSGLTTLSKYPIVETRFHPFDKEILFDSLAAKGILISRIQLPNGHEIDVYNLHLQSGEPFKKKAISIRKEQLKQIADLVQDYSGINRTILLVGDFNFIENSPEYDFIVDEDGELEDGSLQFLDISRELYSDPSLNPFVTYRYNKPLKESRLDYVLLRPASGWTWEPFCSDIEIRDLKVSDHNALLAQITLRPEESS